MGLYIQGAFGPFSGRVGNLIGTFWKGRAVMRIRPASVTDANTLAQQTQRLKFKIVASFIKLQEKFVKLGFAAVDKTITPFNNALKFNITNAVTGAFPDLSLDLTKVRITKGNLENLSEPALTSPTPGAVKIDWIDNTGTGFAKATDKLFLSFVDPATSEVFNVATSATRVDETMVVNLPASWTGRTISVIGFLTSEAVKEMATLNEVSESATYGTVTIA